jgi:predicted nucleic acid-binding protein
MRIVVNARGDRKAMTIHLPEDLEQAIKAAVLSGEFASEEEAAVAIQYGLELVTGNTSHYQRIQQLGYSLTLVNWR